MVSKLTVKHILLLLLLSYPYIPGEQQKYAGPDRAVPSSYFGMHLHHAASDGAWPAVSFGGWRVWDAGVSWPQLEPQRGKWDFSLLDQYVAIAAERQVDILLTLGLTPRWASSRPDEPSGYGNGNAAPPSNIADWEKYVLAIATRYKGVIHTYEIWNEPNAKASFTGSVDTMVLLARTAYHILKTVDPTITVVSPSGTADTGLGWLQTFISHHGCEYSDVIGYHFYVTPAPPETMMPLIQSVQRLIHTSLCADKPLWNTESGWSRPKHFETAEEAGGYLIRTYLLNWLMGVRRCYWYAWDNHNWSTLDLTSPIDNRMTNAGAAYGIVRQWMLGATLSSCMRDYLGTWICYLDRNGSTNAVIWCDKGRRDFVLPAHWHMREASDWKGRVSNATASLAIGPAPILLLRN